MTKFLLFCMTFIPVQAAMALSYTLEMTEAEIQQKVSAMMPIEKKILFGTVKLFDPKIALVKESNEIAVATEIRVNLVGGLSVSGTTKVKGQIRYEAKAGEFFLKDSTLEEFVIEKLPEKYHHAVKVAVEKMMQKVLSKKPVYKLKDDNLKHKLVKAVLQSVTVKDEKLVVVFGL